MSGGEDRFVAELEAAMARPLTGAELAAPNGRLPSVVEGHLQWLNQQEEAEPTRASSSKHPGYKTCPGCQRATLAHLICCRRCWAHLPRVKRDAVVRAFDRDLLVLANSVRDAVAWLREHPQR